MENQTVDLVCLHNDLELSPVTGTSCRLRSMQWQKVDTIHIQNVSDSGKFGVWETLKGWGMGKGEHASLLRVRAVQAEDVAGYRCQTECRDGAGVLRVNYQQASMCIQHGDGSHGE